MTCAPRRAPATCAPGGDIRRTEPSAFTSAALTGDERRDLIRDIARRLRSAKAPVHFVLPLQGIEEWDRDGSPLRDEAAMAALNDEVRQVMTDPIQLSVIDVHINDPGFSEKVLEVLDGWIEDGTIKMTR